MESGIQERIRSFNKTIEVEQNKKAILLLDEMDVKIKIGFIVFDPFTTIEDLLKEIKFLRDVNYKKTGTYLAEPFGIRFPLSIYPGTAIYDKLLNLKLLSNTEKYGYKFVDHRMSIFIEKTQIWQEQLKKLTWDYTEKFYYVEDQKDVFLFNLMSETIGDILQLDLDVCENLLHQILQTPKEVQIEKNSFDQLSCYLEAMEQHCKSIKTNA